MKILSVAFAKLVYALRGWGFEPIPHYWESKQVIIGFPHRSNLDTVMAFAGFMRINIKGHVLIKKTWFFWPLSYLLRGLGGIPVDRSQPGGVVEQMVAEFSNRDEFILALVPEGSRRGVTRLKTGFWHIAKDANVPIICWYLDHYKRTRWVGKLTPGDCREKDMKIIKKLYSEAGFDIPDFQT